MGSLDSLLDTMTNVVGVLIVVLIVTQVNVSSAAKRIRANLPEVTVPMMEELRKKEKEVQARLASLQDPADVKAEEVEKAREDLRALVAQRKELKEVEARFKKLDLEGTPSSVAAKEAVHAALARSRSRAAART